MISIHSFIPILIGSLVLITYILGMLFFYRHQEKTEEKIWKQRLDQLFAVTDTEKKAALSLIKDDVSAESYFQSKLPKIEGMKQWIQHAGFNFSPAVFIESAAGLGITVFVLFFVIFHISLVLSLLISLVVSLVLPWAFLAFFQRIQKKRFMREFPVALDIMRRALRAGYSADRALEMVAEQQNTAIGRAFRMISDKMRLGEPAEQVLTEMSNRIGIDEFRMLAVVFVLQRETGGSLAEAAENFAKVIQARENLRKKISALTGEVRMTAMVLTALPFFILGAIYVTTPQYLNPLFSTDRGHILLMVGGVLLFVGIGIIFRMSYKEMY